MPMIHPFSRVSWVALVAVALLPSAGSAQTIDAAKLDYRKGLRSSLAARGDVVTGEFPSLDPITATVHCEGLTVLATFGSIRAVSTNGPVAVASEDDNIVWGNLFNDDDNIVWATLRTPAASFSGAAARSAAAHRQRVPVGPRESKRSRRLCEETIFGRAARLEGSLGLKVPLLAEDWYRSKPVWG